MPKPNHSTKKKPGSAQWFKRRNVAKEQRRRWHANNLAFLENIKKL